MAASGYQLVKMHEEGEGGEHPENTNDKRKALDTFLQSSKISTKNKLEGSIWPYKKVIIYHQFNKFFKMLWMSLHQVKDLFCWMLYWKILQILLTTCSKFFQKPITFLLTWKYRDKLCRSLFNDMPVLTNSWLPSFPVSNPYQIQIYSSKDICQYKRCILDNRCEVNNYKLQNVCLITMSNVL